MKLYSIVIFIWQLILRAWTTPKTWTAEPLTSTDMNTYIRDNQNDIRARQDNNDDYIANEVSNYTTTSSSFVDVDGTNLNISLTTLGGDVLVGFAGSVQIPSGDFGHFNIAVDSADYFGDDGVTGLTQGNATLDVSFVVLIEGLSAGVHTFELRWKIDGGGTATLWSGAGTTSLDFHPQFWVQEI